jgi:serine/threonine-protein kinase 11
MSFRSRISQSAAWITGKDQIDTTYGERRYVKQINQYKRLAAVGEGTSSRVFVAMNTETTKLYALKRIHIKKLRRTPIGTVAIEREIALMSRIQHQNIVRLHDVIYCQQSDVVYLVLDYANCGNMAQILKSGYRFTPLELRYIFKQIAEGVAYLHGIGIVHQDLKPQNILLTDTGAALISDFGAGHSFESSARGFGTPLFQAPELIDHQSADKSVDPGKEDIWSLGISLYYLHFNRFPFQGTNVFEIIRAVVSTSLHRPNDCDPLLWDLIEKKLNVDLTQRFDIQDVMKHEYVSKAPSILNVMWKKFDIPTIDDRLPVKTVHGIVCSGDLKLPTPEPRVKEFTAPFPQ